jgi:putative sterol carrier protein
MRTAVRRRGPRRAILWVIFRLMERQLDSEKARDTEAVIHWTITTPSGDVDERWQLVLERGTAKVSRHPDRTPSLTITIDAERFIELASGTGSAPAMFMQGKLKVDGDLMLAARLPALFRIPQPRRTAQARGRAAKP